MSTKPGFATFLGQNGYHGELKRALKILEVGKSYEVIGGDIGQSYTSYRLKDIGSFNSVMFDADESTLPLNNPYLNIFGE